MLSVLWNNSTEWVCFWGRKRNSVTWVQVTTMSATTCINAAVKIHKRLKYGLLVNYSGQLSLIISTSFCIVMVNVSPKKIMICPLIQVWQKCGGAHEFEKFTRTVFSLVQSTWSHQWVRVHRVETKSNWIKWWCAFADWLIMVCYSSLSDMQIKSIHIIIFMCFELCAFDMSGHFLVLCSRRPDVEEMCRKDSDLGGENHFHLEVTPSYLHCSNASILSLEHQYDPTLTVMLTMVSLCMCVGVYSKCVTVCTHVKGC